MSLIMCRFFVRINLGLENYCYIMKSENQKVAFQVKKLNICDKTTYNSYDIDWSTVKDANISQITIFNEANEQMIFQENLLGKDNLFKYGFKQYYICSLIEVIFEETIGRPSNEEIYQNEYFDLANKHLDTFIDLYRYTTQNHYIKSPKNYISPVVEMLNCQNATIDDITDVLEFLPLKTKFQSEMPTGVNFDSFFIGKDSVNKFSNYLNNGYEIKLYEKILLNALEQAHVYKDYPLCIVLIETAFEAFIKVKFKEYCKSKAILTIEVKKNGEVKTVRYQDAIDNGNIISDIIINYINKLLGTKIEDTDKFKSWKTNAYKKRNQIIHNGKLIYNSYDAETAFDSTVEFMKYLELLLKI